MDRAIIERKVRVLLSEQLGAVEEEIKSETKIVEGLGADSLDIVELVMAMEEELELDVADAEVEELMKPPADGLGDVTFGELCTFLEKKLNAPAAAHG